jgi:hypothetical protein
MDRGTETLEMLVSKKAYYVDYHSSGGFAESLGLPLANQLVVLGHDHLDVRRGLPHVRNKIVPYTPNVVVYHWC